MDKHTLAWICLALTPNVGPKTIQKIQGQGITPDKLFQLSKDQLEALKLNNKSIQHILSYPPSNPSKECEQVLQWAEQSNQNLITPSDQTYPERLKQISTAPPLLMVHGEIACLSLPQIAIVGSRYPTASGQTQAFEFAHALANEGMVITSGLARGIDGFAHKGALQAGGKTIAVLGTGLLEIYPKQHKRLADEISEQGAVISEFPLHTKGLPGHFPRRNRIVSGLSLGTLVVEATLKSGSLITARQALEQNREVFAIPGPISNPQKAGCHYLIRQGATLVEQPEHIFQELSLLWDISLSSNACDTRQESPSPLLDQLEPEQYHVLKAVDYEGLNLDELVIKTKLEVAKISVMLMELELTGLIRQEQGVYSRI